MINFSGPVKGAVQISDVYCETARYLLRHCGTADVQLREVHSATEEITDEPRQYRFWWADEQA